jgi:hypothetical protein
MRAELHLHARGGRRKAKNLVKLELENTTKTEITPAKTLFCIRSNLNTAGVRHTMQLGLQDRRFHS